MQEKLHFVFQLLLPQTAGFSSFAAVAIPFKSPPPPTGTKITSKSGISSIASNPIVPWPAIVLTSLNA